MKLKHVISTAKGILTNWDYSNLDDVMKGDGVIDFKALVVKAVVILVHMIIVLTLPVSVFIVLHIARVVEIRNLKSWVKTIRMDRGFFNDHHYIEIKRHIDDHRESYHLTLDW